jgi:hypothetical protein
VVPDVTVGSMVVAKSVHRYRLSASFVIAVLALLPTARAEDGPPLTLQITANKQAYLIAEPIFLEVSVSYAGPATGEIQVRGPTLPINFGKLRVNVTEPDGKRVRFQRGIDADGRAPDRVFRQGDRVSVTEVLTYNANTAAFVLESSGSYRIQAQYPGLDLVSNTLTLQARKPPASLQPSAEAFQTLELARFLDFENISGDLARQFLEPAVAFVGESPDNIYEYYIAAWLGCSFARSSDPERKARSSQYLQPVLAAAGREFAPRPIVLLQIAENYADSGSYSKALDAVTKLRREHPTSAEAKRIKEEDLDFLRRKIEESGN